MKAQNLTISIPPKEDGKICDKNCEYCISRMTGYIPHDYDMVLRNIEKVKTIAKGTDVSAVLLTGKGEPLLNFSAVTEISSHFRVFPLEIQTNGLWLSKNLMAIGQLKACGMDVISVSIDSIAQLYNFEALELFKTIREYGLTVRVCLNLTDKIDRAEDFKAVFDIIKSMDIDQLVVRNIMVPNVCTNTIGAKEAARWISRNTNPARYEWWYKEFMKMVSENKDLIRVLPHGAKVYDLDGIGVSFSDYCIQEANNTEDIRSLIFLEDGHLYTAWDKMSSRLF